MKQSQALAVMKLGHNVFLTGEPGSGKTHTLNQFIDYAHTHGIDIGITASTGIAATHIGGMTIHSWSGLGIKDELADEQLHKLATRPQLKGRLKRTRVLIIDEISMLDGARLELLNRLFKIAKNSDKPFGGLQVVLCGDLFQLPPVTRYGQEIDFAHQAAAWQELDLKVCYLSEQHRQDEDQAMLDILRQIRLGEPDEGTEELLRERTEEVTDDPDLTRLYSHNLDVDSLNTKRLHEIDGEVHTLTARSSGGKNFIEQLQKSCLAPESLELKVGAQVLCVANSPAQGFVNGSRAEVVSFEDEHPVIELEGGRRIKLERHTWKIEDNDRVLAGISQFPLRLAWAITVHKSQGMSLDQAEIDLSRAFTPGMGYVALSRLRRLDGLYLRGMNQMALRIDPSVSEFDAHLRRQSDRVIAQIESMDDQQLDDLHRHIRTNLASPYAEYDRDLLSLLKSWRTKQAKEQSVPAYLVFDDKTLLALAAEQPATVSQLEAVPGIGPKKLETYGKDILEMVNRYKGRLF